MKQGGVLETGYQGQGDPAQLEAYSQQSRAAEMWIWMDLLQTLVLTDTDIKVQRG